MASKKIKERKPIETKILVVTKPNGYALEVDGKGYMYFDVVELTKGLILHAGLGRQSPMSKFGRNALLKAIGDGSAEQKLQNEINKLKLEVFTLRNRLNENKEEQEGDKDQEGLHLV